MDPRGIGDSTPVQCFHTTEQSSQAAILLKTAPSDPGQFAQRVAAARDFATRCAQRDGDLLAHLSTANVARDLDLLRQAVGDRKLTYDGISYGTYLGAAYAALFPGIVRALVLDENFDALAYRAGGSTPFLRSNGAEGGWATLQQFFQLCAAAGSARCAFAAGGDPARKVDELVARVRQRTITLPGGDVVEYGTLLAATFRGLFVADDWSTTAQLLQDVYAARPGDAAHQLQTLSATAAAASYDNTQEGQLASACGETSNPHQPALYPGIPQRADRKTPYAGTWLTWFRLGCTFWTAHYTDRFTGTFRTRRPTPLW
jgi:pimeloyl-ACP methyl ester carboxylesterase